MNRIYKTVLTLSIAIQLSLFFIAATAGLWIDQLMNGEIGQMATYKVLYETVCISIIIVSFLHVLDEQPADHHDSFWYHG